jgi:DNA-binding PadR family transcriptional regulator
MQESPGRGALTEAVFFILASLVEPTHGYGIMQQAKQLSGGRVDLGAGTLYGALGTLGEKGWIAPTGGEQDTRRKLYRITATGVEALRQELARLEELILIGKHIIGEMDKS